MILGAWTPRKPLSRWLSLRSCCRWAGRMTGPVLTRLASGRFRNSTTAWKNDAGTWESRTEWHRCVAFDQVRPSPVIALDPPGRGDLVASENTEMLIALLTFLSASPPRKPMRVMPEPERGRRTGRIARPVHYAQATSRATAARRGDRTGVSCARALLPPPVFNRPHARCRGPGRLGLGSLQSVPRR